MSKDWPQIGDPLSEEGAVLDHRFRLESYLGEGPIHYVFQAKDLLENARACVKVPKPHFRSNEGFIQRYRRDVLNVMLTKDTGWITPLMLGEAEGTPFQVLPLVQGKTLGDWYRDVGRKERALLRVLKSLLKILSRLHNSTGQIHGSLKPGNILINDIDNEPVLLDLAATGRLEDHFSSQEGSASPIYHAPEQVVGEKSAPPADLYSLGLVLYEALASRHPFLTQSIDEHEESGPELLLASLLEQLDRKPSPTSSYREDVPQWADRFLARCLHPHPKERFTNPDEALEWLQYHTRVLQPEGSEGRALVPIGREQEMDYLTSRLKAILEEPLEGSLVVLTGAEGIGKTRCTDWLAFRARNQNVRVLDVKKPPESGLHLQSVVSALKAGGQSDKLEGPTEARPVVEGLIEAALDGPILMFIHGIQEADDTLVELLKEVNTVVSDLPVLLVLVEESEAYRNSQAREFVASLEDRLELEPLDRRAIANIIEECAWSPPSSSVVNWVHKVSEGNALAARLLVEFLQETGALKDDFELDWKTSPPHERPTLETLIKNRLNRVPRPSMSLLESAAVLGDPFSLNTLRAITYQDDEEVDVGIGNAVNAGVLMLEPATSGPTYRWTHPLFHSTVWDSLYERRRERIHRLAAAFYSRGEPEPAKLAYHFLQSGDQAELFHWGSLAAEKANRLGLRGECNYWLNVLLSRVPDEHWLGPNLEKARTEVGRDQSEVLDMELWTRWLRSVSGRPPSVSDASRDTEEHLVQAQRLLSSGRRWEEWKVMAADAVTNLSYDAGRDGERADRCQKGLDLMRREWEKRSLGREPFPV